MYILAGLIALEILFIHARLIPFVLIKIFIPLKYVSANTNRDSKDQQISWILTI